MLEKGGEFLIWSILGSTAGQGPGSTWFPHAELHKSGTY
jgi:hypothetical protein